MKKLFLLALAAASVTMVSAQEKNTTQIFQDGHKLSVEWTNDDVAGTALQYRAGIGDNDKFYLIDYAADKLYIYGEKGQEGSIDVKNAWVAVTVDKAHHVLVRWSEKGTFPAVSGSYPGAYYSEDGHHMKVINTLNDQVLGDITMNDGRACRFDAIAKINGDVTEGTWQMTVVGDGGTTGNGMSFIYNGMQQRGYQHFPVKIDPAFGATNAKEAQTLGLAQYYGSVDGQRRMAVYPNNYLEQTSSEKGLGNGIMNYFYGYDPELDEDDDDNVQMWRPTGEFFITPQHGSNNGFEVFSLCGKWYIVYTSGAGGGTNAPDAFAISEVKFTDSPLTDAELDKTALVARLFPVTNETGANMYKCAANFTSYNVVPVEGDANSVYIYTYTAGAPMIKCKFTAPDGAGIDNIVVDSNVNAPVEYYNLEGVRVANPGNGIFIQRQGNKVTKVIY